MMYTTYCVINATYLPNLFSLFILTPLLLCWLVNRSLEALHRKELDNNKLLRQQLSAAQSSVRQLRDVQNEAETLRSHVNRLQNVQAVINGESQCHYL